DDRSGRIDIMLFSDALERYQHLLVKDKILVATGQISVDDFNGGLRMIVRELMDIDEAREKYARGLAISLLESQVNDRLLKQLQQLLEQYKEGVIPIRLYYQRHNARAKLDFGTMWRVSPNDTLL